MKSLYCYRNCIFGKRWFGNGADGLHLVDAAEVIFWFVCVWFHCLGAWFPAGWAHLTMDVCVLECLYQTQCLVNTATNWQIVDSHLTQRLLAIDDVQATEWDARLFVEYFVGTSNFQRLVGQQGNVQFAQTALLAWCLNPCQMGEVAVCWATNEFATNFAELLGTLRKSNDFRWTNECAESKGKR